MSNGIKMAHAVVDFFRENPSTKMAWIHYDSVGEPGGIWLLHADTEPPVTATRTASADSVSLGSHRHVLAHLSTRGREWARTKKWVVRLNTTAMSWIDEEIQGKFKDIDEAKRFAEVMARVALGDQ